MDGEQLMVMVPQSWFTDYATLELITSLGCYKCIRKRFPQIYPKSDAEFVLMLFYHKSKAFGCECFQIHTSTMSSIIIQFFKKNLTVVFSCFEISIIVLYFPQDTL